LNEGNNEAESVWINVDIDDDDTGTA